VAGGPSKIPSLHVHMFSKLILGTPCGMVKDPLNTIVQN
jgi:hypothetical protein